MARWGAMTISSPAAQDGAVCPVASSARAPVEAPMVRLSSRCVMVAFLRPEKGTSKAFPLQYCNRHPFSSKVRATHAKAEAKAPRARESCSRVYKLEQDSVFGGRVSAEVDLHPRGFGS